MKLFKKSNALVAGLKTKNAVVETTEAEIEEESLKVQIVNLMHHLKPDASPVVTRVIQSHLQIMDLVDNYALVLPCTDRILENLHQGLKIAKTEEEREFIQNQSCELLISVLFNLQAQLLMVKSKTRKQASELFKMSNSQYMQAVSDFTSVCVPNPVGQEGLVSKVIGAFQGALKDADESYEIYDTAKALLNNKRKRKEYFKALNIIFEKLYRNRTLLGKSLSLSEAIRNQESELASYFTQSHKMQSALARYTGSLGFVILMGLILVYFTLTNLLSFIPALAELDSSANVFLYASIAFVPWVYRSLKYFILKKRIESKYDKIAKALAPEYL